jgi:hypothetical protein
MSRRCRRGCHPSDEARIEILPFFYFALCRTKTYRLNSLPECSAFPLPPAQLNSSRAKHRHVGRFGLVVVLASRPQSPPSAQASPISKTTTAAIALKACGPVIDQIVTIAKDESARIEPNQGLTLAVIDQCVRWDEQVDTTGCPADFRMAENRFITAEQSLCRDAHNDSRSDPDVVRRAFFDVYAHRSPYDTLDPMSEKIKRDLDTFQNATFDLIQVSDADGVN